MRVFLVRHGDADAEIPEGLGDAGRALTAKGRQTLLPHLEGLRDRIGTPHLVLTSPLVRTVQTAQLLAVALDYAGPLRAHRCLQPEMPVGSLDALVAQQAGTDLVLVGHQPVMSGLAAHLLSMQTFPRPVVPGTVIGIEREDDGTSRLLFYAAPGQPVLESV